MRRAVLATLTVVLLALAAPQQALASTEDDGIQPWGTWVWRTSFGPGMSMPALLTLHRDGTVSVSDGLMFGGLPGSTTRTSPLHGVWERTGPRRIGGTSLWLIFDAPSGVLVAIGRCRTALQLTRDGEGLEGKMFLEILPCNGPLGCQDPIDPAAQWEPYPNLPPTGFVSVTATRLHRVPAGPLVP
jgi:hypothetical protein